jgi:hypothetical protein
MSETINIDDIITELGLSQDEKKEVQKRNESKEMDVEDASSVASGLVDMVKNDREKADEIFNLFYTNLAKDTDRSQASKEALTKALELKIEASKNIIELLKIKTRTVDGGTNVFVNAITPKKAGIDINNIREAANNES